METPSPQTNRVLQLIRSAAEGTASKDELNLALTERIESLEKSQKEFQELSQPDTASYLLQPYIEQILLAFNEYDMGLKETQTFLQSGDKAIAESAVERLIHATMEMASGMQNYNLAKIASGPTSSPYVNIVIRASENLKSGVIALEEFKSFIKQSEKFMADAAAELNNPKEPHAAEELEQLKEGYRLHQQAMDEISKFLATGDQIFLDKGIEILKNAGMMLRSSYTRYADEKISTYPTRSGEANMVLLAIEEFKKGNIEEEQLDVILLGFEEHIAGVRKEFEDLCMHEVDSILIQEEIPMTIDAFDKIDAACTEIREFFDGGDTSHLDNGAGMLKSAVADLAASYDTFESIKERGSIRVCFKCSAENPVEAKVCTNCGAVLPKMFDDAIQSTFQISETREVEFASGFVMTENIDRILDAANRMADGIITAEEFLDTIKWMEGILARASLDLAVMKNPPLSEDETEAIENQKNLLREGIRIIGEGLVVMKLYLDDPDKNHLIDGAKIIWQGSREIQEILKLTEELPPR